MAQIIINEVSKNYQTNVQPASYATVALPITACWGPAFDINSAAQEEDKGAELESTVWHRFPATREGLEAFVSTYRGPVSNYRSANDYSYYMAMTLLSAGYDVLVCRVTNGKTAKNEENIFSDSDGFTLNLEAKYIGTFGNSLYAKLLKKSYKTKINDKSENLPYWNLTIYSKDVNSNSMTAVETLTFHIAADEAGYYPDSIPSIEEIESNYVELCVMDSTEAGLSYDKEAEFTTDYTSNTKLYSVSSENNRGSDYIDKVDLGTPPSTNDILSILRLRLGLGHDTDNNYTLKVSNALDNASIAKKITIYNYEKIYEVLPEIYGLLEDKLNYNPQRIICPWCDTYYNMYTPSLSDSADKVIVSPTALTLMRVANHSRCAVAYIDVPKNLPRSCVYNIPEGDSGNNGYIQELISAVESSDAIFDESDSELSIPLFCSHSAMFAPWGKYKYIGMGKQVDAPPSFLALMIMRAMIKNQAIQYEWALPTNRTHTLKLGSMEYAVRKKQLDVWQNCEDLNLNVITEIPGLGMTIWGNSTLFEVPPATYNALENLSTRHLMNAVKDIVYRVGVSITFNYNNDQAYNKFYAGVTPLLDAMKNVGAIDDYYVRMSADINGIDHVNANTVIGKIWLVVNGVINDIIVDLIALPPGTDLNDYKG